MSRITKENTGNYLKQALVILKEHNGEYPAKDILAEMQNRLTLTEFEKSLNNSGQHRWITNFRFYSIGLVKAGLISKGKGIWHLSDTKTDFSAMDPLKFVDLASNAYDDWSASKIDDDSVKDYVEEVGDEPEILMEVKPDDITFANLIADISTSRIQIPPFQRSFVWSPKDIRYLLDSIYRGYPIGSFIFWKTTRKLPRARTIGSIVLDQSNINPGTEIAYVLDGQQRITSLYAAVKGSMIEGESYRFLFDLRSKKFVVRKSDVNVESDTEELLVPISALFLGLASYDTVAKQYPEEYRSILVTLYDRFASYRFSVIDVIDKAPNTEEEQSEGVKQVVRMFSRINETGKKLTVVAKMVARCWGEDFDLRESLDTLSSEKPLISKLREETILQVASVILNYRKCRSRDILERTNIRKLESEWENIVKALLLAIEFVYSKLHIKQIEFLPFDSLLVPLSYLFYQKRQLNQAETSFIEHWFWRASLSNRYDSSVESKIEEDCIIVDKLLIGEVPDLEYFIDWESLASRLISQRYSLLNAFSLTVLSLLSNAEPMNITDGRAVSLDGAIIGYYKHNLHHIFPLAYLRDNEAANREVFDSLMNIMFIPAITNQSISATDPKTYFKNLNNENANFSDILIHHFIPDIKKSGVLENNFLGFLDYRASQIVLAFRIRTGMATAAEAHFDSNPTHPIDTLENRLRELLHDTLKQEAGGSYWEDFIPQDIQQVVDKKVAEELKRHPYNVDELVRDDIRITFLDVMDYSKIIFSNWDLFALYFGSKGEVEKHFVALKNYRNQIKHGRVLNEIDKRTGEAAVLWLEKILLNK